MRMASRSPARSDSTSRQGPRSSPGSGAPVRERALIRFDHQGLIVDPRLMTKPPFRLRPVVWSFLAVLLAAAPPALAAQQVGFGNLSVASTIEYSNATKE